MRVEPVEKSGEKVLHGSSPRCRFCRRPLEQTFVDLGMSPLCESYVPAEKVNAMEGFYPLHVRFCNGCFLVQLEEYVAAEEIFSEYAYFSSYSDSWLKHASDYVEMISRRLGLGGKSQVVEVASNDGYLLQYFVRKGIPALGIEPAGNVAAAAEKVGVPTVVDFFGERLALSLHGRGSAADLIIGNNVIAQVPDLNDFVKGLQVLLKDEGVITLEFPHLVTLIEGNQFDTIYHEHFSYFSLFTMDRVFEGHGLRVFDVEEIPTHGGSLRVYGCRKEARTHPRERRVEELLTREREKGIQDPAYYRTFAERVKETKRKLLEFLISAKRQGKTIAGYGAPGKGNTLLNYCGIRTDFIDFTVDRNPYKQGKFLPGTHIPIFPPERIREARPDYVLILPWNLREEISRQLAYVREWGARLVVPIPEVEVF